MTEKPLDKNIASPCIRNCCLDERDICLGCARHLSEIVGWQDKSNSEKKAILVKCQERKIDKIAK